MKLSKINCNNFYQMLMADKRIGVDTQIALRQHEKALTDITQKFDLYITQDSKAVAQYGDAIISTPFFEWQMFPRSKKLKKCVITQSGTDTKSIANTINLLAKKAKELVK